MYLVDVEIKSVELNKGLVTICCNDVSDDNLERLERLRDDGTEKEVSFVFDSHDKKDYIFLRNWLRNQKVTKDATTWGEALNSIVGIYTQLPGKFRVQSW